jgi:Putative transmembrane protein (PGPGW)
VTASGGAFWGHMADDEDDIRRSGAAAQRAVQRQLARLQQVVERRGLGARVGVVIVGVLLVIVGAVLLVVPGPGWPLIFMGVASLAVTDRRLERPVLAAAGFVGRMNGRLRGSPWWAVAFGVGVATAVALAYLLLWR